MKNPLKSPVFWGLAAAGAYHAIKGTGIFNRPRFAQQHDAISKYVETNYPNAAYSPIIQTQNGWATVITAPGGKQIPLYVSRTSDGVYVYKEGSPV